MTSCPLSAYVGAQSVTGPSKDGSPIDPVSVLQAEASGAGWRTLLLDAEVPTWVDLHWSVGTSTAQARLVVGRGATVSLFARSLHVRARGLSPTPGNLAVIAYDGRTDTRNVWTERVVGDADGLRLEAEVPPFAQQVRLEVGDATHTGELLLLDPYNKPRFARVGGPGEAVTAELGANARVFYHLPAGAFGRLVFTLPF